MLSIELLYSVLLFSTLVLCLPLYSRSILIELRLSSLALLSTLVFEYLKDSI